MGRAPIHGFVRTGFEAVREAFADNSPGAGGSLGFADPQNGAQKCDSTRVDQNKIIFFVQGLLHKRRVLFWFL